ncbi:scopoletin glucosyltransferase-like [Olea europaea subsp. europaea]|uniref:Scopoletin glucosyltransferase-like n=1 Tax=Olea europaea subsp. europaea TaxID=158383 RepID=A0A8S0Q379_OLEEU|nr:scopoletin glucosyltransferase-like [Olea europaea subsp. europaea]
MIPTLDMAKLFISMGVKTTIIATPGFDKQVENARESGFNVGMYVLKFPPEKSELPDEIKSPDQILDDLIPMFVEALELLQEPVEKLLEEFHPDCFVADMLFPWAADFAAKFDIPRLVFHGTCYLSLCSSEHMRIYEPFKNVSPDSEQFVLPNLQ